MKETPNCSICAWSEKRNQKIGMLGMETEIEIIYCQAQGGKASNNKGVYDSRQCRKLYKPKTDVLADMVMGCNNIDKK